MGVERANHGGAANQGQNGYRNNYRNNYWQSETTHNGSGNYSSQKFETGQKYDVQHSAPPHGAPQGGVVPAPKHERSVIEPARNGFTGTVNAAVPSPLVLEKKLSAMQQEMTQALQESNTKENEKFELIFSILMELQKRQAQLEESVKGLKAHFGMAESPSSQQSQQQSQQAQQGQQSQQQTQPQSPQGQQQNQQQVNGQMGQMTIIGMGSMGGQMAMAQQYGGMVATDGSQTYFTPVVVAMPQGGAQMMTMMPQIMAPAGMMPMQQQVAMPFMTTQVQSVEDYQQQWNMTGASSSSNNGGATARSSGSVQNEENNSANGGEHYKMDMPIEEEEE